MPVLGEDEERRGVSLRLRGLRFMQRKQQDQQEVAAEPPPVQQLLSSASVVHQKRAVREPAAGHTAETSIVVMLDCEHSVMAEDLSLSAYSTARRCYGTRAPLQPLVTQSPSSQATGEMVHTTTQPISSWPAAPVDELSLRGETLSHASQSFGSDRDAALPNERHRVPLAKTRPGRSVHRSPSTKGTLFKSLSPSKRSIGRYDTKKTLLLRDSWQRQH
ncbi:hypothetical protein F1559_003242 [Cyanidiococcus yangmingshanensis]|uniref:Uncharacterized protein n=1 Tax=Cyanidiococcus yangmingshanensis TaxID=2690220 RepID=A0A7J7IGY8_9RHOD|nr:hypothetical protein F1559_003242 [Cyanidiococcus yangmingshanensis]